MDALEVVLYTNMKSIANITTPEFHKKGWGYELWFTNNGKYCGKLLHFDAGKRCSFHYHEIKHEHFYIAKGIFQIRLAKEDEQIFKEEYEEFLMYPMQVLEIPVGLRHQMIALPESEIIEISTEHFEDDSYRVIKGD